MNKFKTLLQSSIKSTDTEETIDVYFTRPIGLAFALLWNRLGIHPIAITLLSMCFGVAAGYMFHFTDWQHNLYGVGLLMLANFCDSTDGQMARLSGKKTLVGRVLDGFSGDVWFFCIYAGIALRLQNTFMPYTDIKWGIWIWVLAGVAGILCHAPQCSLSDYYRQIHLFFLKGREGSELDNYKQQRAIYDSLSLRHAPFQKIFYYNYANYCKWQERRTPRFQAFFQLIKERFNGAENLPIKIKEHFLKGSRPLMKYTNILTFNTRAISLYASCLLNIPWLYLLIEITIMSCIYIYMHKCHELLCEECIQLVTETELIQQ